MASENSAATQSNTMIRQITRWITLSMLAGALSGCFNLNGIEYAMPINQVVVDEPIAMPKSQEMRTINALHNFVWSASEHCKCRIWFQEKGGEYSAYLVDERGLVPLDRLVRFQNIHKKSEENDYSRVNRAVNDIGLPTVPFELIPQGDNLIMQSRYGKLYFVQYLAFEPSMRHVNFFAEANTDKWLGLYDKQNNSWWAKIKRRLHLDTFSIEPNLSSRAGFAHGKSLYPDIRFHGGGKDLEGLISEHGSGLFAGRGGSYNKPENGQPGRFARTNLPKPQSPDDADGIARLVADIERAEAEAAAAAQQNSNPPPPPPPPPPPAEGGDTPPATPLGSVDSSTRQEGGAATPASQSAYWANTFASVPGWGLDVANSPLIRCRSSSEVQVGSNPSANLLASVSQSQSIAVFVHGLNFFADGGRPSLDALEADWASHIATLKSSAPSYGYCLVAWDTDKGVSAEQTQLAYLMFALRTLADLPEVYAPDRTISVVAHSAGGLYAKEAYLKFTETHAGAQKFTPLNNLKQTRLRIVTLGSPHQGAEFATDASKLAEWFPLLNNAAGVKMSKEETNVIHDTIKAKVATTGVQQLRAIAGNPFLKNLNRQFSERFPSDEFVSVLSQSDEVVKPQEARTDFGKNLPVQGLDHESLLKTPSDRLRQYLARAYRGLTL